MQLLSLSGRPWKCNNPNPSTELVLLVRPDLGLLTGLRDMYFKGYSAQWTNISIGLEQNDFLFWFLAIKNDSFECIWIENLRSNANNCIEFVIFLCLLLIWVESIMLLFIYGHQHKKVHLDSVIVMSICRLGKRIDFFSISIPQAQPHNTLSIIVILSIIMVN